MVRIKLSALVKQVDELQEEIVDYNRALTNLESNSRSEVSEKKKETNY